jgi:hypothetical protein
MPNNLRRDQVVQYSARTLLGTAILPAEVVCRRFHAYGYDTHNHFSFSRRNSSELREDRLF